MSIAIACRNVDIGSSRAPKLNGDMAGGSETIYPDPRATPSPLAQTGQSKGSESNNTGAEKRRSLFIGELLRQLIGECCCDNGVFGKSAIHLPSGQRRGCAEILPSRATVPADTARFSQPGNPDAISNTWIVDIVADLDNAPHDLMTGNNGRSPLRKITFNDMQVGAADSACVDPDKDFIVRW